MASLYCLKQQKKYTIKNGTELLKAYKIDPTLPLKFGCCNGECGVCAIRILEGHLNLSKISKQEAETLKKKHLGADYRLACQCAIFGDVAIEGS